LTFEVARRDLTAFTYNVQTSIFGVLGFFVLVSDAWGAVRGWVGESLIFNYKTRIKISPFKTFNISDGMITYIEYTFVVTDEI
jgi:hypothetical protein